MLRQASGGRRDIGDFFRNLWTQTGAGARKYAWANIRAALEATAPGDWEGFYQAHIRGHDPLPLGKVLPLAGLKLGESGGVELDPGAPARAKALWRGLTGGR